MFVSVWQDPIVMFQLMTRGVASPMRSKLSFLLLVLFRLIKASFHLIKRAAVGCVRQVVFICKMTYEFQKVIKVTILWKMFLLLSCL